MSSDYLKYISLSLLLFFSGLSCKQLERFTGDKMDSGMITYAVEFPEVDKSSLANSMLPTELEMVFNEERTKTSLEIGFGLIKFTHLSNSDKENIIVLLDVFGKKYAVDYSKKELEKEWSSEPDLSISKTDSSKIIEGLECREARVRDKNSGEEFSVFYSSKINIPDANWFNPYRGIDGVLMEYPITKYQMRMELKAIRIEEKEIENNIFEVPEDYKSISKEEFDQIVRDLLESALET